jgi:hypothetical protein
MNDIDALLLGLDAEPGTQLTPAETARSERLLAQVTQCAPSALAQYAGARPAAVRRRGGPGGAAGAPPGGAGGPPPELPLPPWSSAWWPAVSSSATPLTTRRARHKRPPGLL